MTTVSTDDIKKLEMAAEVMMAPPNQVTPEHRREAEAIFISFRNNTLPIKTYQDILENAQNSFVLFEVAQGFTSNVLKQWHTLTEENVINICQYLLQYPVLRTNLPNYVVAEVLRTLAIILKKHSVESDILNSNFLIESIERLIRSSDEKMQTIGLLVIEALTTEFSTNWRSSLVSVTWDFNNRAKRQFENNLLKNFLKLALSTLSQLLPNSDLSSSAHQNICDKFLRVAVIVLSWNFSPKLLHSLRLRTLFSITKTNAFQPPLSWTDFFQDASIITFFMELHSRIRNNEELSIKSLNCLTQLASLMGDVLGISSDETNHSPTSSRNQHDGKIHDLYVQTFIKNIMDLFDQMHEYEMLPVSIIIYKLFTYHPFMVFKRFPVELFSKFVVFLFQTIKKLTGPALEFAIIKSDQTYHEALHNLYQVWRIFLRSMNMFDGKIESLITTYNRAILEEFYTTILAPPYGIRQPIPEREVSVKSSEDEDDRDVFMDVFCDLGYFSLYSFYYSTEMIIRALHGRIQQFQSIKNDVTLEEVRIWQEDMHWLFLIIGYQFQQNTYDYCSNFPEEIVSEVINGYKSNKYVRIDFEELMERCLAQPLDPQLCYQKKLDPITLVIWYVFSWSVLEHGALESLGVEAALISPELTRSSLWVTARLIAALSPHGFIETETEEREKFENAQLLPHIPIVSSVVLQKIVEFILSKVFTILTKLSGEEKLCVDAIQLIIFFADYRAEALVKSEHLYTILMHINIENLPSRRPLVKSLLTVGAVVLSKEVREKIYKTVLEPLLAKFLNLLTVNSKNDIVVNQLTDLFECFAGVADAGQSNAAPDLFAFLQPVFQNSVALMYKYPNSQLLVNSILEFFDTVSDVLFFYVESSEDCSLFHSHLLSLIEAYRQTQSVKYQTANQSLNLTSEDELDNQVKDLVTLINILCHSVSKTFMPTYDGAGSVENSAKVAMLGLEIILPLMNEELLKIPILCKVFFKLLNFVTDLAPNVMINIGDHMMMAFMQCLRLALDNLFGSERVKSAVEIINNLVTYLCEKNENLLSYTIAQHLLNLTPEVFKCALEYGNDSDLFDEANNALYALLCLNKDCFLAYVNKLMERPENAINAEKLEIAFFHLLPESERLEIGRIEKRAFRNRLEKFLTDIYGLLFL